MTVSRIATASAPAAVGPYSQGVSTGQEAGSLVFVSGQVPLDPPGQGGLRRRRSAAGCRR